MEGLSPNRVSGMGLQWDFATELLRDDDLDDLLALHADLLNRSPQRYAHPNNQYERGAITKLGLGVHPLRFQVARCLGAYQMETFPAVADANPAVRSSPVGHPTDRHQIGTRCLSSTTPDR